MMVLADDLTGAAEIGGVALQFGLTAGIRLGHERDEALKNDIIIIDTASRSLEPGQAYQKILEVISKYDLAGYELVFKKVDSVLRGPVVAEVMALLTDPGFDRVLMIPANPSRERIIRDGRYLIGGIPLGKTGFRHDPIHPRLSAAVRELLDNDRNIVTGKDPSLLAQGKIFIPDVISRDDICRMLSKLYSPGVLLAGGSDLFQAFLSDIMQLIPGRNAVFPLKFSYQHFISGSSSEISIDFARRQKNLGYVVFTLPGDAIRSESVFLEWIKGIEEAVKEGRTVVVSGPTRTLNDPQDPAEVAGKIARAGKVVAGNARPGTHLFMEGGDTASLFFREMGWDRLIVSQVHDVGVVTLKPEGAEMAVTVKPGSYPWPENLMR
jgi:uncharacterized protein YgbK (DUF1537 family)